MVISLVPSQCRIWREIFPGPQEVASQVASTGSSHNMAATIFKIRIKATWLQEPFRTARAGITLQVSRLEFSKGGMTTLAGTLMLASSSKSLLPSLLRIFSRHRGTLMQGLHHQAWTLAHPTPHCPIAEVSHHKFPTTLRTTLFSQPHVLQLLAGNSRRITHLWV